MDDFGNRLALNLIVFAIILATFLYIGNKYEKTTYENIQEYNTDSSSQFEIVNYDKYYHSYTMRDKTTDTMYIKSNDKYTQMLDANSKPVTYDAWCNTNRNKANTLKSETKTEEKDNAFEVVLEDGKGISFLKEKATNAMYVQSGDNCTPMLDADGKPLSYEVWNAANQ